jgi:muramoyltetrapeptide carboxypeptidase LdcA involved in peptidoglycan recycling
VGWVEVLDRLRGTQWWPELEGAVLAIETSEDAPSPSHVAAFLCSLAEIGDLGRIAGLLVGRPGGSELPIDQNSEYDDAILKVISGEQRLPGLPVVTSMDFSHTDPMWTLPESPPVLIDAARRKVTFTAPAVI